ISPSKAASRKLFNIGANAPSLPYSDLPERNCSSAFFLISSRLNCSSFFCSIICVKVGDFSVFDTAHFTVSLTEIRGALPLTRAAPSSTSALCTLHSSLMIGGSNFVLQNFDRECSVTLDPSSGVRRRRFFHNPGL